MTGQSADPVPRKVVVPAFVSDPALAAVLHALPAARLVGGSVRDALAGRPVADVDLATPDRPEAVMAALRAAGLKAVPTGIAHGTITAVSGGRGFEVTTLRHDVETDGRHASVDFSADWRADAARRDFTINAMSLTRDGLLFDWFGGERDLRAGLVRFVGDPATRIAEDYLRILRFFRFQARYGTGDPDPAALAAIRAGVPGLGRLSAERVWSELSRILAAPDPAGSVRMMANLGVLAAILPEGADPDALGGLVASGAPADPVLRLAALLAPEADADTVAQRLRLSTAARERLVLLRAGPPPPVDASEDDLRRALAETPAAILDGRSWLDRRAEPAGATFLRGRLSAIPRPRFPLEGRHALALGIEAGPRVGALLRDVRAWWMAGGCRADETACRAELARRAAAC